MLIDAVDVLKARGFVRVEFSSLGQLFMKRNFPKCSISICAYGDELRGLLLQFHDDYDSCITIAEVSDNVKLVAIIDAMIHTAMIAEESA